MPDTKRCVFMYKLFLSALFFITSLTLSAQGVVTVDNELLLGFVVRLLDEGKTAMITGKGKSMLPFIENGEKLQLSKGEKYGAGDIVLAHLPGEKYVLHRVISYSDTIVTLMGDGNLVGKEHCHPDSIKAVCRLKYDDNGNEIFLDSDCFKSRAELWQRLLPLRENLLSLYSSKNENEFWKDIFRTFITSEAKALFSIRPTYEIKKLGKETILYSKDSKNVYFSSIITFSESAEFLFLNMKGKVISLDNVVNIMLDEYEVDKTTATKDCIDLLTLWFALGIIKIQQ